MRHINPAGLKLIRDFEGCRLTAYRDLAGVPTIGFGHTGPEVRTGMKITQERADELLANDLRRFERGVEELCGMASDNQFSAMVSLAFNIGLTAFARSTVLKRHKLGNRVGASRAFQMWIRAGGKIVPGLIRRREAERALYLA